VSFLVVFGSFLSGFGRFLMILNIIEIWYLDFSLFSYDVVVCHCARQCVVLSRFWCVFGCFSHKQIFIFVLNSFWKFMLPENLTETLVFEMSCDVV
jgi:hypothetical protein